MATITETREVAGFTEVQVSGWGKAIIEQGETEALVIEADEEIIPRLSSEVRDGRLVLSITMEWWEWIVWWWTWLFMSNKEVTYYVTMVEFRGARVSGSGNIAANALNAADCQFGISGSGNINVDDLDCDEVEVRISGSGNVVLAGKAETQNIRISGSGSVKNAELATERSSVEISGSGSTWVDASESLDIEISGSGSVRYRGQPRISQHMSGSGSIKALA